MSQKLDIVLKDLNSGRYLIEVLLIMEIKNFQKKHMTLKPEIHDPKYDKKTKNMKFSSKKKKEDKKTNYSTKNLLKNLKKKNLVSSYPGTDRPKLNSLSEMFSPKLETLSSKNSKSSKSENSKKPLYDSFLKIKNSHLSQFFAQTLTDEQKVLWDVWQEFSNFIDSNFNLQRFMFCFKSLQIRISQILSEDVKKKNFNFDNFFYLFFFFSSNRKSLHIPSRFC